MKTTAVAALFAGLVLTGSCERQNQSRYVEAPLTEPTGRTAESEQVDNPPNQIRQRSTLVNQVWAGQSESLAPAFKVTPDELTELHRLLTEREFREQGELPEKWSIPTARHVAWSYLRSENPALQAKAIDLLPVLGAPRWLNRTPSSFFEQDRPVTDGDFQIALKAGRYAVRVPIYWTDLRAWRIVLASRGIGQLYLRDVQSPEVFPGEDFVLKVSLESGNPDIALAALRRVKYAVVGNTFMLADLAHDATQSLALRLEAVRVLGLSSRELAMPVLEAMVDHGKEPVIASAAAEGLEERFYNYDPRYETGFETLPFRVLEFGPFKLGGDDYSGYDPVNRVYVYSGRECDGAHLYLSVSPIPFMDSWYYPMEPIAIGGYRTDRGFGLGATREDVISVLGKPTRSGERHGFLTDFYIHTEIDTELIEDGVELSFEVTCQYVRGRLVGISVSRDYGI